MALGPAGTVFVGTQRRQGLRGRGPRPRRHADQVLTIASGLDTPNGVAFRDGALYVAEMSRILRFDAIEDHLGSAAARRSSSSTPSRRARTTAGSSSPSAPTASSTCRVGAPCNVCEPTTALRDDHRASNADGSGVEVVRARRAQHGRLRLAPGDRRSSGSPTTAATCSATTCRRDELNRAPRAGAHFGFPFCHAGDIADPEFGERQRVQRVHAAGAQARPARRARSACASTPARMFPAEYRGQIFIAEHGSWNRSTKIGYRVIARQARRRRQAVALRAVRRRAG